MIKLNFQISNPDKLWENTPAKTLSFESRQKGFDFARKLSYVTNREIRVTEGNYKTASGTYIKY